jgi:hypothetical protein
LIYADWLEEHGDPRAEYLRLCVEERRQAKDTKSHQAALAKKMQRIAPQLDAHWVDRIWQARRLPRGARLDLALVGDGQGLIEVRGGQAETILLVEGRPVALNWDDCQGSIGQYLVFSGHARGSDCARQLREFVESELDDGQPLAEQIGPLLALFAPGVYCLEYVPSAAMGSIAVLERPDSTRANRELGGYYPFDDRNLICTQARESLDERQVAHFQEQILAQRRPLVLTASAEDAWCEFVIDGHHKLAAYDTTHVNPSILSIIRWQAPAIRLEEGLGCLPAGHPGGQAYRRMKKGAPS